MWTLYHWAMESAHNMGVLTSQYFSPNAKYWTASSGNRTRAPPDGMWTLNHWAMESIHNMGVLVSWPRGRGQILLTIAPPHPPASIHVYLHYGGGGGALPTSPLSLNTCSHNTATRRPPHPSNTQQPTITHTTQQQTTTHNHSTQQHAST